MAYVKHVVDNTKLSLNYVNSFGNTVNFTIPEKGIEVNLDDGSDLAAKVKKYIDFGVLKVVEAPKPQTQNKVKEVNPFESGNNALKVEESKSETKNENKSQQPESDDKSEEKQDKKSGRPPAKKSK